MGKRIKPPNKETIAAKQYNYLDLPKNMEECFYELELVDFTKTESEDKYAAVFKVLDTDTKLRPGCEVSHLMDPYQKFAETYFWRDVFTIYSVCRGKEPTKEYMAELADKHEKVLEKLEAGKANGGTCRVDIRSYEKDEKKRTQKLWSTLSAE